MKIKIRSELRRWLPVFLLAFVLVFSGCEQKPQEPAKSTTSQQVVEYPLEIVDGMEQSVRLEAEPKKIVSLAPNNTEILYALGLGDRVIAVTDYCNYPEETENVEKIGSFRTLDVEKMISLKPDLVLSYGLQEESVADALKNAGIPVISYMPESIDQIYETIRDVAKATNVAEKGKELIASMEQKKKEIAEKLDGVEPVTVFYEVADQPLMTAGEPSFINQLITLAQGEDIAAGLPAYSTYAVEDLIAKNPEVYLVPSDNPNASPEAVAARPGFGELDAVKNGRIVVVNADIASRPGPRIIDALEEFAKAIHPEAMK